VPTGAQEAPLEDPHCDKNNEGMNGMDGTSSIW
jgi:hypothetical protein